MTCVDAAGALRNSVAIPRFLDMASNVGIALKTCWDGSLPSPPLKKRCDIQICDAVSSSFIEFVYQIHLFSVPICVSHVVWIHDGLAIVILLNFVFFVVSSYFIVV